MGSSSPLPLEGQVALVTGANSGIGAAIVRALSSAGAAVAINYVTDPEAAKALVRETRKPGMEPIAVRADVGNEGDVEKMFAEVFGHFGALDILVSNAGIQRDKPLVEMSLDEWEDVLRVNLTGAFLCAREAARLFSRREAPAEMEKARGKIVFTSSVHQTIPWSDHVNYAASKGGLHQLMRSVAQELAPLHIRVNGIAPGAIKTPINHDAWSTPEAEKRLLSLIPFGRVGVPEDIADVVVWLVSDAARYITGTTIFIDGGMTLYPGFSTGKG